MQKRSNTNNNHFKKESAVQYSNAITYIALLKPLMLGNDMLNAKMQLN